MLDTATSLFHIEISLNTKPTTKIKILHVDDDPCILQVSKSILELEGNFEVDSALSVDEAFKKLEEQSYDAVISDYEMPQKNGLQFLKELRQQKNEIPFILFTGKGREEVAVEALNLGADGYINKQGSPETVYGELSHGIRSAVSRKKAEEALRVSEEKLRRIFESSPDPIAVSSSDAKIIDCNPAALKTFGYSTKSTVIGRSVFEFFAEKERAKVAENLAREGEDVRNAEYIFQAKNGREFIGELSASPVLQPSGEVECFVSTVKDITERKKMMNALRESEEKYRRQFEEALDAIFVADAETGILVDCNPAACELVGRAKSEIVGMHQRILHSPEKNRGEFSRTFKEHIGKKKGQILETQVITKSGEIKDVAIKANIFTLGNKTLVQGSFRDVTERKKAEELLKDSVAKYRDFAESLPEIVFEIDAKGNLVFVNQKASQITGYSQDEFGNNFNFIRLVVPDEREKAIANIKRLLSGENVGSNEYNLVKKDGAVFPVMIWATPRIVQNKVAGLRGIVVDISEHKKAEESLRETKEYFDNLLNYANAPIIVWDNKKKITLFNNAFEAFTGYSKESMLRENIEVLFPASHKTMILETIGKATRGEKWQSVEVPILCKDEQTRIALWNSTNVTDKDGNIVATIAQGQDITERKKAEEERESGENYLKAIFKSVLTGIIIINAETHEIVDANPQALETLGTSKEQTVGKICHKFVCPAEKGKCPISDLGQVVDKSERTLLSLDGEKIPILKTVMEMSWKGQKYLVESFINITDRKKTEEALNQSMDELVLVNEKLNVVGGLTRHDVRNKLSAMTGYAFLLKKKHADQADIVDGLGKIDQACKEIGTIFDFAKMYEQLGVEELKYINAEKALNEAIALFSGSSSLEFINDCHGLSLLADSLLTQLFYNLIDNSLKHGEKVTKIRVHYEKADQDELIVVFEDDGVGISAENKPKLFKEGFSTSGTSGYGLFLMRKMINVYGWSIQENGEPGKGAKFTMTIPRISQNGKENFQIA